MRKSKAALGVFLMVASAALGQGDDRLVGVWARDEGFQVIEFLFRSDGRYQVDTRSTDPVFDFSSSERGRYEISGQTLTLTPYDYLSEPQSTPYQYGVSGDSLSLSRLDFPQALDYQFRPGSRADVLARENVDPVLVRTWRRHVAFYGINEYTFRPAGYYVLQSTPDDSQFPPEFIRGRYEQDGTRLTIKPYSGVETECELDFFGDTLTLIMRHSFYGESATYQAVPGSDAEVQAKAAEANAFLQRENWQVGVWEIRDGYQTVDLTIRPDGHYVAKHNSEFNDGIVRGRYTLESGRIHLLPFVGQGLYGAKNGEFGNVERTRELDYYDGALQFIDLEAISQSVTIARKRPGSEASVMEKAAQASAERERKGWQVGIWVVNDPAGWMEFTFRPDQRYIAKAGTAGVPQEVERGRYLVAGDKLTLAPYALLGEARGLELDLYDGDLFLIGDLSRMVAARKVPGSETEVAEKTNHPNSLKGERGSLLGLWTANLPGQSVELVLRTDGQFRLARCQGDVLSRDYGLYTVDLAARTMVYDSRFIPVQTHGLDFYGDTMTIYGGNLGFPNTYAVNLGLADAAIAASFAADAEEAEVDAQWLARVPVGPLDPNAVQVPGAGIPADPHPERRYEAPTVFTGYRLYRRFIPGYVTFLVRGEIESVPVLHSREWHFFPTGRVLVRFTNHRAGAVYPHTIADAIDTWGAYRIEPKPDLDDILHLYADNALFIETDAGEQVEMTLEDGRRHLFWNKDVQLLSEWAAEQQAIPCELPDLADPHLMNTRVSLSTSIEPDEIRDSRPVLTGLAGPVSGHFTISGLTDVAGTVVTERATSLSSPRAWHVLQTNSVPGGPFSFPVPEGANPQAFFRVRWE